MAIVKRAFILGAGFSKPSGMPLATDLLPLIIRELQLPELRQWLKNMQKTLNWLSDCSSLRTPFSMNIEQVFHYAYFWAESFRLQQHLAPVGRYDGDGTSWNQAENIDTWLGYMERAIIDVIFKKQQEADLSPITRWATCLRPQDVVLTFNYDTLVESALSLLNVPWNHGTQLEDSNGVAVFKLHGSLNWTVADRHEDMSDKHDLLFDKRNDNRNDQNTNHVEDDSRLWKCKSTTDLREWLDSFELQTIRKDGVPRSVGIAGLGPYKPLHRIPGLGEVWSRGMQAVAKADQVVIVGFSMSEFDAFAQVQLAEVARSRKRRRKPLPVVVIDPCLISANKARFKNVFRSVKFKCRNHETFDWRKL